MNENEFWSGVVKVLVIGFCVVIATFAGCTANRVYQTRALIENAKVNPIEAKCALEQETLGQGACVLRAAK